MKIQIAPPLYIYEQGQRPNQEDSLWPPALASGASSAAKKGVQAFLVCDGMGGHEHGEVASQAVAMAIGHYLAEQTNDEEPLDDGVINDAVEEAYKRLDALDTDSGGRKMGTTLTLLCLHRNGATMAHIGDSRIYHIRTAKGHEGILYLSRDHSLVMEMYLAGELSKGEMETYDKKNVITRAMQPHQERRSRPDIVHTTDLRGEDYFFLCSDGIMERLADAELVSILCADMTDEEKLQKIKEATKDAGDNHTAYLIRIESVEKEPSDTYAPHDEDRSRANFLVAERCALGDIEGNTEQVTEEVCNAGRDDCPQTEESWIRRFMKSWKS